MNENTSLPTSNLPTSNLPTSNAAVVAAAADLDEAPVWTADAFKTAVRRVNLLPVERKKQKVSITFDPDVLAWFKARAGGRGYQTLMNAALRNAMQQTDLESTLRRIVREELHAA